MNKRALDKTKKGSLPEQWRWVRRREEMDKHIDGGGNILLYIDLHKSIHYDRPCSAVCVVKATERARHNQCSSKQIASGVSDVTVEPAIGELRLSI